MFDVSRLEAVETTAFREMFLATPVDARERLGLSVVDVGKSTVLRCRAVDHPQFNRVLGMGVHGVPSREEIDTVANLFRENGSRNAFWQLVPGVEPPADLGLGPRRRWLKVVRDGDPVQASGSDLQAAVVERADADAWGELVCAAFGMPPIVAPLAAAAVARRIPLLLGARR